LPGAGDGLEDVFGQALRRRLTAELAEEKFAGQDCRLSDGDDYMQWPPRTLRVARESLARLARNTDPAVISEIVQAMTGALVALNEPLRPDLLLTTVANVGGAGASPTPAPSRRG